MSWSDLEKLLRNAQRRVYRLANLAMSERYLDYFLYRTGRKEELKTRTIGELNNELRGILRNEGISEEDLARFARKGSVPDTVCSALSHYKLKALASGEKWKDILRGKASLPTFRSNMAIPVRCDKLANRRLERMPDGDVQVDLMVCIKPSLL